MVMAGMGQRKTVSFGTLSFYFTLSKSTGSYGCFFLIGEKSQF